MKSVVLLFLAIAAASAAKEGCMKVCTKIYAPVCSTDGKTLPNKCEFEVYQCEQGQANEEVSIAHEGECKEVVTGCPVMCPAIWHPVCGSDGKTYDNDCHLEAASCRAFQEDGVDIHLEHVGACVEQAPAQECPIMCTADFRPVCGSNGKTYTNQCRLDVANCRSKMADGEEIVKVHEGICKVARRSVENPCMKFCTRIMAPVCGSDGKTYNNKCLFEIAQCEQSMIKNEIVLAHAGPCKAEFSSEDPCLKPCNRILSPVCSSDGQTLGNECLFEVYQCQQARENKEITIIHDGACQVSKREAEDSCLKPCNRMMAPVCSSDGKTLGNKCLFEIYQCQQGKRNTEVSLIHDGPCSAEMKMVDRCFKPCNKMRAPVCSSDGKTLGNKCLFEIYECEQRRENVEVTIVHDGPCREKRSEDSCMKPCSRIMAPVCSSDGKTLPNKCEFEVYQCQRAKQNSVVSMAHDGACKESAPKDPCMRACPAIWAPVCSSDGKTMQNKCSFEAYQCTQRLVNDEVTLVHEGPCRNKRSEDSCMKPCFRIMAPVCSSDGKTLPNKCEFEVYQCQQAKRNSAVTMVHDGACEESAPRDPCVKPCPRIMAPVCSSDGKTFDNECAFDIHRCKQARENIEVTLVHAGPCKRVKRDVDSCNRACPEIFAPVCSSDGKTFDNRCSFEAYQCQQRKMNNEVVLIHQGACHAEVVARAAAAAAPAMNPCWRICDRMMNPVCASDGKTLNNKCLFEEYQCEQKMKNEEVVLVHDGPC